MKAISLRSISLGKSKHILLLCASLLFLNGFSVDHGLSNDSGPSFSTTLEEEIPFFQVELFPKGFAQVKIDKVDYLPFVFSKKILELDILFKEIEVSYPPYIKIHHFLITTLGGRSPPSAFPLS